MTDWGYPVVDCDGHLIESIEELAEFSDAFFRLCLADMAMCMEAFTESSRRQVPMIWNWQGKAPVESVRPELVSFYDFLPTICDAASAALPGGRNYVGRSYLPLVQNRPWPKGQSWPTTVFGQSVRPRPHSEISISWTPWLPISPLPVSQNQCQLYLNLFWLNGFIGAGPRKMSHLTPGGTGSSGVCPIDLRRL